MLAWFPHIHSKERDVFENHGKKLIAALFAAGLLGAVSSWAQAPGGPEGMGPMRGFERLHKELNLNAQQEDLWKRVQTAQREAFRSMRARGEETRAKLRVEIDKPGADLKQFAQLRDELGAQMRAQMEAARIAAPGSPGRAAATWGLFPPGPSGSEGNRTRPLG